MHRPNWFQDGVVVVSTAPTCGINKDGEELFKIDPDTGLRTSESDNRLWDDVQAIVGGGRTPETVNFVAADVVSAAGFAVPTYYDSRPLHEYHAVRSVKWPQFGDVTLGELVDAGRVEVRGGHGSPSADVRKGDVPYIKVSDLRAGQVNINPTNRVSRLTAERFWRDTSSGLQAFDLISPARTSKNIGDFSVLMPGQEDVVLTKEVLVLRATADAGFDQFYLLWALSLRIVRAQWQRLVFMQTNREDVGARYRELVMPMAPSRKERDRLSKPFRDYYDGMARAQREFVGFLERDTDHHVFLGTSPTQIEEEDPEADAT